MKVQSFMGGIAVLFVGGVLAKILGAIFRVPLTWVLGAEGLGIYQLIYPVFALIIVLASSGIPTAISKMTATRVRMGDNAGANDVLRVGLIFMGIVGAIFSIALLCCASLIASLQGNPNASLGYYAIAPAVFFVSILSVFRGYFQGHSNMTPTALSQIIEQAGKLVFGLILAFVFLGYGVEYGALGAILGVTISEIIAVAVLAAIYIKDRKQAPNFAQNRVHSTLRSTRYSSVLGELVRTSVPIVLASVTLPLLVMIDSFLVVNLLNSAGLGTTEATKLWGIESGVVTSLVNMPIALCLAVAISIVPAVAGEREKAKTFEKINQAFYIVLLFCTPILIAFMVLPEMLISFLYSDSLGGVQYNLLAGRMMLISSPILLLGSILQVQNSSLQALGKGHITLIFMLIAGVAKILCTLFLVPLPSINIYGCVISNLAFYALAVLLNSLYMRLKLKYKFRPKTFAPCLAGGVLTALIFLNLSVLPLSIYFTLPCALILGGLAYILSLWAFGVDIISLLPFLRRKRLKN